mmetsp:Transcript_40651/g.129690  ORF Transcript_40651/g.129690 Transcript_40651/m.129690 type:complete len:282 (+) Transcript_40651:287-1132(+)
MSCARERRAFRSSSGSTSTITSRSGGRGSNFLRTSAPPLLSSQKLLHALWLELRRSARSPLAASCTKASSVERFSRRVASSPASTISAWMYDRDWASFDSTFIATSFLAARVASSSRPASASAAGNAPASHSALRSAGERESVAAVRDARRASATSSCPIRATNGSIESCSSTSSVALRANPQWLMIRRQLDRSSGSGPVGAGAPFPPFVLGSTSSGSSGGGGTMRRTNAASMNGFSQITCWTKPVQQLSFTRHLMTRACSSVACCSFFSLSFSSTSSGTV